MPFEIPHTAKFVFLPLKLILLKKKKPHDWQIVINPCWLSRINPNLFKWQLILSLFYCFWNFHHCGRWADLSLWLLSLSLKPFSNKDWTSAVFQCLVTTSWTEDVFWKLWAIHHNFLLPPLSSLECYPNWSGWLIHFMDSWLF